MNCWRKSFDKEDPKEGRVPLDLLLWIHFFGIFEQQMKDWWPTTSNHDWVFDCKVFIATKFLSSFVMLLSLLLLCKLYWR
jgi:hypothetical protein